MDKEQSESRRKWLLMNWSVWYKRTCGSCDASAWCPRCSPTVSEGPDRPDGILSTVYVLRIPVQRLFSVFTGLLLSWKTLSRSVRIRSWNQSAVYPDDLNLHLYLKVRLKVNTWNIDYIAPLMGITLIYSVSLFTPSHPDDTASGAVRGSASNSRTPGGRRSEGVWGGRAGVLLPVGQPLYLQSPAVLRH